MELRVLKYFLAVAREENITRAAEQLHVSQPAVSRQISQLEEELGIRAFERKGKRVTLTEEGRLLRRRAQEMLDLAEKTVRDFRREPYQLTGKITIGRRGPDGVFPICRAAGALCRGTSRCVIHVV